MRYLHQDMLARYVVSAMLSKLYLDIAFFNSIDIFVHYPVSIPLDQKVISFATTHTIPVIFFIQHLFSGV